MTDNITAAANLFVRYKKETAAINPDLKPEIQKAQKKALDDLYSGDISLARGTLMEQAKQLETDREKHSDKAFVLANLAVDKLDTVNSGDLALIMAMPGLTDNILEAIASKTKTPAIQLALLGHANTLETTDLKNKILANVALPVAHIQSSAIAEKRIWKVLTEGADIPREHSAAKLEYAHRMDALDKIIAA